MDNMFYSLIMLLFPLIIFADLLRRPVQALIYLLVFYFVLLFFLPWFSRYCLHHIWWLLLPALLPFLLVMAGRSRKGK